MGIEDLTSQMKQLGEHGEADLKLDETAKNNYISAISTYREALREQRTALNDLDDLGDPGGYPSTRQTKNQLQLNVVGTVGTNGIRETLDNYIEYLDEFEKTVNAAFNRLQAEG